ncbi:hypothetical protein GGR64_002396 [Xanthomonas arboricola]|nr:hypothetical protein [Xanthomonas sp. 3307]
MPRVCLDAHSVKLRRNMLRGLYALPTPLPDSKIPESQGRVLELRERGGVMSRRARTSRWRLSRVTRRRCCIAR